MDKRFCSKCGKPCAIQDPDNSDEFKCVDCMVWSNPAVKAKIQEVETDLVINHHYEFDMSIVN